MGGSAMGGPAMGGPATEGSAEGTQQFMGGRGGAEGAGHGWLPSLPGLCRCLGPPPHTTVARWPLRHPSWGHSHHRNHRTSQGGKAGAM